MAKFGFKRRNGLRNKKRIRKISDAQLARRRTLAVLKARLLAERERCARCQKHWRDSFRGMDLHHLLSRARGGNDAEENLVLLCRDCHDAVTFWTCEDAARWNISGKVAPRRRGLRGDQAEM